MRAARRHGIDLRGLRDAVAQQAKRRQDRVKGVVQFRTRGPLGAQDDVSVEHPHAAKQLTELLPDGAHDGWPAVPVGDADAELLGGAQRATTASHHGGQ